jgi:mannose-6-phosphate isomerase-like protein (cupin superfamily)
MKKANLSELQETVPPLHYRMVSNVVFPDARYGRVGLSVLEKGGGAEMHLHRGSEHYYLMLEGALRVTTDTTEMVVYPGEAVLIEDEEPHQVSNAHDGVTRYFSITAPPPSGWEAFPPPE